MALSSKSSFRKPGSIAVFFREDINLMKAIGNNARKVTEVGRQLVADYDRKYGDRWIENVEDKLKDSKLPDSLKIKVRLKSEESR